jgi:extracellular elastinolytic metalloproteinase
MTRQFSLGRRRTGFAAATVASLAAAGLAAGTSYASGSAAASTSAGDHHSARASIGSQVARDPYVDVTTQDGPALTKALRVQSRVSRDPASKAFRALLPGHAVLDISGTTGTVRWLGNLDGYLTGRSSKSPQSIALRYVRKHHAALGLARSDLKTLHLGRDYRDITGTHHLFFTQRIKGNKTARNGLTASVSKSGHLLTLGGMPISKTAKAKLPSASTFTIKTAAQALARTRGPEVAGSDTSDDTAQRVVFETGSGLRPAWETVVTSSQTPATTVIDAVTGQVLLRTPLTQYENSTGRAYRFFPGSRRGGHQIKVNFTKKGWLGRHAHDLFGNNSHAYSDVNDDNKPNKSEEVHPLKGHSFGYKLKPFHLGFAKSFCGKPWPCSWNPDKAYSWKRNRAQNATQVFYFVNNWHDHLKKAPIGFTEAAGNFQRVNHAKPGRLDQHGKAGDPVATQTDDGANSGRHQLKGLPDGNHIDNANMSTPPDGHRPKMQMYLQHQPGTPYPDGDPYSPTNVGDEADTVYHEYTHGLSNRLNVDVHGRSTLGGGQAGAMGEAWSDWYAMDYLVGQHLERDKKHKADVRLFVYDGEGVNFDRTEPVDCKVGQQAKLCTGGTTGHGGGYTYADYANVAGGAEVHADGEIWTQTLWDLRDRLGSHKAESLVTRAMELAPYNPSFIDMRNAILVADNAVFKGKQRDAIWRVFAHRGMGYTAGSLGGNDTEPSASFALPPKTVKTGTISGTVTDFDSHAPLAGITVSLPFQGAGDANPTTVTGPSGSYTLSDVPVGHFAKLVAKGRGYHTSKPVVVTSGHTTTVDFTPRKDWAGPGTGATASTGALQYPGCGVDAAIDGSQSSGWSSNAGPGMSTDGSQGFVAKSMTVSLNRSLNVTGFGVDPSNTCGDDFSTAVQDYRIETSTTSKTGPWTTANSGTFTRTDIGSLVPINVNVSGVKFVKFTILSNQTAADPAGYLSTCGSGGGPFGCAFTDLTEIEVFGTQ